MELKHLDALSQHDNLIHKAALDVSFKLRDSGGWVRDGRGLLVIWSKVWNVEHILHTVDKWTSKTVFHVSSETVGGVALSSDLRVSLLAAEGAADALPSCSDAAAADGFAMVTVDREHILSCHGMWQRNLHLRFSRQQEKQQKDFFFRTPC